MATREELKDRIASICTHVLFEYNGKDCGVDPFAEDQFDMWYGDKWIEAHSIDEVMTTPLFDVKSLNEIANRIYNVQI